MGLTGLGEKRNVHENGRTIDENVAVLKNNIKNFFYLH
jgi:hypothetical protein